MEVGLWNCPTKVPVRSQSSPTWLSWEISNNFWGLKWDSTGTPQGFWEPSGSQVGVPRDVCGSVTYRTFLQAPLNKLHELNDMRHSRRNLRAFCNDNCQFICTYEKQPQHCPLGKACSQALPPKVSLVHWLETSAVLVATSINSESIVSSWILVRNEGTYLDI